MSKLFSNFYPANATVPKLEKKPTNQISGGTNEKDVPFIPNDIAFRLVLIPFFGIAIPLVTGMIHAGNFSHWQIKLSLLYTIGIAFLIWQGNRYLLFSLRSYFDWHKRPVRKIIGLLFIIVFYTVPLSVLLLVGWYHLFEGGQVDWEIVSRSSLIIMICVIFITHVYETVFLLKETENEMLRNEQLDRARAEAELEALKNQLDPHFIFNSLNTLSHLIEESPAKARRFNDTLADVYRYILQTKARDLVMVKDEIEFLYNYFALLHIRFGNAVQLQLQIAPEDAENSLIPPISLQLLAENAIKHNEFSEKEPLVFSITLIDDVITAVNKIRKKKLHQGSPGIGLQNLTERYKLLTSLEITVKESATDFLIRLPVLRID